MLLWLAPILSVAWAGFWLWFGIASAIHDRLPWHQVASYALRPGLMFFAVVFIAWLWPKLGGLLLVLTGFVLAAWYAVYFGDKDIPAKLFVLCTIAARPLACGLMLLWPRAPLQAG